MVVECLSIIIIILLMSFVFLRARKVVYALLTCILLIVPGVHLLMELFGKKLAVFLSVDYPPLLIALDMVAVVVSCLMIGFGCNELPQGKQRKGFLILSCSYSIILTLVFIFSVII